MSKRVNRDDIDKFHDCKLYLPTRTIYMGSELSDGDNESGVDALMAERFLKNISILEHASSEPITVIMNNLGGDTYHGMAIFDAIQCSPAHVTVKVFGCAMSMGSIILQAADRRIMAPNAKQMVHYGSIGLDEPVKNAERWMQECKKMDKIIEDVYLKRIQEKLPNYSLSAVKKMLTHDTFLTAKESVAMGLADEALTKKEKT